MIKMLEPDKGFSDKVVKYGNTDALLAIGLFFIICALYAALAALEIRYPVIRENNILVGMIFNLFMAAVTVLFVKIRKGKLSSIGLLGGKWKQSCLAGLVIAAILFFTNCLSNILGGAKFIGAGDIVKLVVYYLTVALCEELVFRGYIGTRLYGFTSSQLLVIIMSGILFTVMHFPYRMIAYGMSFSDLTIHNMGWLLDLFITHIVLAFIYMKTDSLYGSIIPHWMSNLAYNLIAR